MLEVIDVHRRFGDVTALAGVSLRVEPGEIVGFVGRNGAGKTTAMRVVLGLVEPDGGEVRWRREPIRPAFRRRIGYLPEERGLYPRMGVAEQLRFLGELSGMEPGAAAESTDRLLDQLGLAARAGDRVDQLSLGNQQRVQLAGALVCDPELLVMDEPFSGLDPVGVDVLSRALRDRAATGVAVLFSSHQLELVEQLCHRVVIIDDGRIVADGPVTGSLRNRFLELAS